MGDVVEYFRLSDIGYSLPNVIFIRIEPSNLKVTINDIICSLNNLSWIETFDEEYIKNSFKIRANATAEYLSSQLKHFQQDKVTTEIGETVVSELSRLAIVNELDYLDIPLAELFKQKLSGNPGFDFFSETLSQFIVFGEAKYVSKSNGYGKSLEQIESFIRKKRDDSDLNDIDKFVSISSLNNHTQNHKAFACAFSATSITTETLIKNILKNKNFNKIKHHKEIILIAVNV
ncbi:hypothetical protein NML71_06980 [Streptococcus sp. CF4-2]|jgi:hypothetical protein|uniref:hypothetical protein n=1 Tax=unclassified Streptococcus TaxID=2608887 RepID=UPI0020C9A356|nr:MULTISPECIES: hypothetical protein [unclassified Streptococcus]MCP9075826.1 hypothetical protein [Streptococcus sp. CF4-3]MCP9088915.1 hypothetical protein [Streptococcus sp. CF4-2]